MKLGRTFPEVRDGARPAPAGSTRPWYVERATTGGQRTSPLADVDPETVPYFSLAAAAQPGAATREPVTATPTSACPGAVVVVGLGPAGPGG